MLLFFSLVEQLKRPVVNADSFDETESCFRGGISRNPKLLEILASNTLTCDDNAVDSASFEIWDILLEDED